MGPLAAPSLSELFWVSLFGAVAGALGGLVLTLLWSPFLLSERIRRLFEAWPTSRWPVNVLLCFVTTSAIHAVLLVASLLLANEPSATITAIVAVGLVIPASAWTAVAFAVREREDGWTLVLLALGAIWYAVLTVVPPFVLAIFYYLPS